MCYAYVWCILSIECAYASRRITKKLFEETAFSHRNYRRFGLKKIGKRLCVCERELTDLSESISCASSSNIVVKSLNSNGILIWTKKSFQIDNFIISFRIGEYGYNVPIFFAQNLDDDRGKNNTHSYIIQLRKVDTDVTINDMIMYMDEM